jgi:RNA polymerase sigma-70 factor, ECF subfamily
MLDSVRIAHTALRHACEMRADLARPESVLHANDPLTVRHIARAYEDSPDEELMFWSASGDTKAFDEIVTRHGPFALRVAKRLIADPALADDVVQEAMVRAWTRAKQYNAGRGRFTTWLYRIVMNLCIDHRRSVRPYPIPEGFDPIDPAAAASDQLDENRRQIALASALKELPGRQLAAMTLVYDEGLSGAEAADVLGVSAKAIERLLSRARASLRARLATVRDDQRDSEAS